MQSWVLLNCQTVFGVIPNDSVFTLCFCLFQEIIYNNLKRKPFTLGIELFMLCKFYTVIKSP